MKAFLPAAGLGTRLRPFTLSNPKALVPVNGVPMLERVILRLKSQGFDDFVINLHHFGDKIEEFVKARDSFGVRIRFSDERNQLLDTGGGILNAAPILCESAEPFLIHNVDILSDADLRRLMEEHENSPAAATLLVSDRESSRRLIFDEEMSLRGWHNVASDRYRPEDFVSEKSDREYAFSGIHVMSPERIMAEMKRQGRATESDYNDVSGLAGKNPESRVFSIIDFYLDSIGHECVKGYKSDSLHLIDIGKPETLAMASSVTGFAD